MLTELTASVHGDLRLLSFVGVWPGLSLWVNLGCPLRWCSHSERLSTAAEWGRVRLGGDICTSSPPKPTC